MSMCVKHNKQSMAHLLELEGCDGFCSAADPCDEIISAVKECTKCDSKAMPENTYPYWYDGGVWMDKENNEVSCKTVLQFVIEK